jgi:hypothetical protein
VTASIGRRPPGGKPGPGNNVSGLRDAPFRKVTMETAPAEQNAAIKCCSEECLATSRAFPVRQPGSKEKVGDKSECEEKTWDVISKSDFENCSKEKTKDHEPAPAVRSPGVGILWIHPRAPGFARAFLQFRHLHANQGLTRYPRFLSGAEHSFKSCSRSLPKGRWPRSTCLIRRR